MSKLPAFDKTQVLSVGIGQMVAWASSTYLPAVLATPMAGDFGVPASRVFAAFSGALILMALAGPLVGRLIDRHGGRYVLCAANLMLAGGLVVLAGATASAVMFLGWALIGLAMALGLYDAAFAALVRQHGLAARAPITGITLIGGFASTLGWPLTTFLVAQWDWRVACLVWAAANLLVALPLNYYFIPALPPVPEERRPEAVRPQDGPAANGEGRRDFVLLALFGAATAFVTSAMAAHLPGLLLSAGVAASTTLLAAAMLGPSQVLARLGEFIAAHKFRVNPLLTARVATALHPLAGLSLLGATGVPAVALAFAVLHGAGNGLITIAKGTLPLYLFGARGYGVRQGKLAVAQRAMQALAPFLFSLVLEQGGAMAGLALTVGVSLLALAALFGLCAGRR